jgi:hypothetical protein
MSEAYASAGRAIRHQSSAATARGAADWLSLAAAPTFAVMALLTADLSGGAEPLCSLSEHDSLISGMVPMYLLMSAFHSGAWLKLVDSRRNGAR